MHACMQYQIRGFNVRGSCLIRENHEHLYPRNIPAIRYTVAIAVYSLGFSSRTSHLF